MKREASVRRRGSRRARNLCEEGGVRAVNEGDHGSHVQKHIQSKAVDSVSPGTKEKKKIGETRGANHPHHMAGGVASHPTLTPLCELLAAQFC